MAIAVAPREKASLLPAVAALPLVAARPLALGITTRPVAIGLAAPPVLAMRQIAGNVVSQTSDARPKVAIGMVAAYISAPFSRIIDTKEAAHLAWPSELRRTTAEFFDPARVLIDRSN